MAAAFMLTVILLFIIIQVLTTVVFY